MKLKELFGKVINKKNNQVILNAKKKAIKKCGFDDIDDLLDMEVSKKIGRW